MTKSPFRLILGHPTLRMLAGLSLIFGFALCSMGPFQSLIGVHIFGLPEQVYAVLLMVALGISVSASVGIGIITDQRPSRRAMALLAGAAMFVGPGLVLLFPSQPTFILAHALLVPVAGTLFGQIFAVTRLIAVEMPAPQRDGLMATVRALFAVPWMVALPVLGVLIRGGMPLVHLYFIGMLMGLLLVLIIWRHWPADAAAPWVERKSGLSFRASIRELLHFPVISRVMLMGITNMGGAAAGVLIGLVFAGAGRDTGDVSLFFAIFVGFEVFATLGVGFFLRVLSRMQIIAIGTMAYALFLAVLPLAGGSWVIWPLAVLPGIGGGMVYALTIAYFADLLGKRPGAGASLVALQRLTADGYNAASFAIGTAVAGYWLVGVLDFLAMGLAIAAIMWLDRNRPFEG